MNKTLAEEAVIEIDDEEIYIEKDESEDLPIDWEDNDDDDDDETSTHLSETANEPSAAWKDKRGGVDNNEMSSRRINRQKALESEAKEKTTLKNNDGKKTAPTEQLAAGLQKVSTKIKQNAYDDDEEDEKSAIFIGTMNDNSLADALNPEENQSLKNKKDNDNNKIMQNAGKLEAINQAEKMANEGGVKLGAKIADKNIASATYSMGEMGKTLNKDIAKELKIKKPGKIPASKNKDLIKGVKNIKEKGGKVENMNVDTVAKAANASDKAVAEIIYKNSTRSDKKKIHEKSDVKTLKEKTGRGTTTPSKKDKEKGAVKEIEKGNVRLDRPQKSR